MKHLLIRLLLLSLCLSLTASAALAEGVRFTLTADVNPSGFPDEQQRLMESVASLLDSLTVDGSWASHDGSFDLSAAFHLAPGDDAASADWRVYGLDSHWGVQSSLLGSADVMINHLALMEFAVKAYNLYGLPMPQLSLLSPYAHRSAFQTLREEAAPLLSPREEPHTISADELQTLAERIIALTEEDRALRYWCEVMRIALGADRFDSFLYELPQIVAALCPDGLTVSRDDNTLSWSSGDIMLLSVQDDGQSFSAALALPGLISAGAAFLYGPTFITGSVHTDCELLRADASFSLPVSLPVILPFSFSLEADGTLLSEPLHLVFEGEGHGSTVYLRRLTPDHAAELMTVTAELTPFTPHEAPAFTPENISGVNLLSVNSDSLAQWLSQARTPLLESCYRLVVCMPPTVCQTLMDTLEDSGLMDTLVDALLGMTAEY